MMSRQSSGSGSVPEEGYDQDQMGNDDIIDSPISAADMLSRAAKRKRMVAQRDEKKYARTLTSSSRLGISPSEPDFTPGRSTKRLFPDTPEVRKLGLTPTSRNHSQRKSKRARKSQYDNEGGEDDDELNDTIMSYRNSNIRAPIASTPFPALRKQPIANRTSFMSEREVPSNRRTSDGSITRFNDRYKFRQNEEETSSSSSVRASQFVDNSSTASQKQQKASWLARWGAGKEESPMDILRRLATAPGSFLSTPSSVLERILGSTQSKKRQSDTVSFHDHMEEQQRQPESSSSVAPTPSNPLRDRRTLTNVQQQRRSMANTSAAISDLGQARRHDPRQSRISTNLFNNLISPGSEVNETTIPRKSFMTQLSDLPSDNMTVEDREMELQRILAGRTAEEGFAFTRPSKREIGTANMFDNLLDSEGEEEEDYGNDDFSDYANHTATPAVGTFEQDNFRQDDMQNAEEYEGLPYEEDEENFMSRRRDSTSNSDVEPESGKEEMESDVPMRIPRGGYEELYNLDSDSDSEEYLVSSSEEGENISEDDVYGSRRNKPKSKAARRASLLHKKKPTRTRKVERISRLTNKPVVSMRSTLIRELFRKMVTPNISVGAIPGPSKSNSTKAKQKKVALDEQVYAAVEDITHEFFVSLADSLKRSESRNGSRRFIMTDTMIDLMKEQGIIDSQTSLVSIARKMMPRELSDQLAPNLDKESDDESDYGGGGGGRYEMGNISTTVFNQEDFSSSVSEFSQSGSDDELQSESNYGEMGNLDRRNQSGTVELLTFREPKQKVRLASKVGSGMRKQKEKNRHSSSLPSRDRNASSRSRQSAPTRPRSSRRRR